MTHKNISKVEKVIRIFEVLGINKSITLVRLATIFHKEGILSTRIFKRQNKPGIYYKDVRQYIYPARKKLETRLDKPTTITNVDKNTYQLADNHMRTVEEMRKRSEAAAEKASSTKRVSETINVNLFLGENKQSINKMLAEVKVQERYARTAHNRIYKLMRKIYRLDEGEEGGALVKA